MGFETPVLLLAFNRPEHTKKVLEVLRKVKPTQLYVAVDGPRLGSESDEQGCKAVRYLFDELSWDCQLHTLFRDDNLGCARSVSVAITWFFEHVESGIILEDDCVPSLSFFPYCRELLETHRSDERIMHIGSNNFQNGKIRGRADYYYSIFNHLWGWATWREAWEKFQFDIDPAGSDTMREFVGSEKMWNYFQKQFESTVEGKMDSWGFRWTYSCWKNQGLSIVPNKNLVSNIGFGENSTHTSSISSPQNNVPSYELTFPLRHPKKKLVNRKADEFSFQRIFMSRPNQIKRIAGAVKRRIFK
jgi:hypothetical protein